MARIESFPREVLGKRQKLALLFKTLATLRTDAATFDDVDALHWQGQNQTFAAFAEKLADPRLLERFRKACSAR